MGISHGPCGAEIKVSRKTGGVEQGHRSSPYMMDVVSGINNFSCVSFSVEDDIRNVFHKSRPKNSFVKHAVEFMRKADELKITSFDEI